MDKDTVEDKFRRMGAVPITRDVIGEYNLYIADGYSAPPHLNMQKLGIKPDEFPFGMQVVPYFLGKGEKLYFGSVNFYSSATDQKTRIDDTKRVAKWHLDKMIEARRERGVTN